MALISCIDLWISKQRYWNSCIHKEERRYQS